MMLIGLIIIKSSHCSTRSQLLALFIVCSYLSAKQNTLIVFKSLDISLQHDIQDWEIDLEKLAKVFIITSNLFILTWITSGRTDYSLNTFNASHTDCTWIFQVLAQEIEDDVHWHNRLGSIVFPRFLSTIPTRVVNLSRKLESGSDKWSALVEPVSDAS